MTPKNILVPMDFTPCSKNALKFSIELCEKWKAQIHILHASQLPAAYVGLGELVVEPLTYEHDHRQDEMKETLLDEFPKLNKLNFEFHDYLSRVEDAIYTQVKESAIDLIVMGTKGSHDTLEKMVGSITAEVIDESKIPILVIPENFKQKKIKRIGVAIDAHIINKIDSIANITNFANLFDAEVLLFNVEKANESLNFEHSKQADWYAYYLDKVPFSFHHVKSEKIQEGINKFSLEHHLDMLVMFPRHHDLFERLFKGSTTKKMVMNIQIPLLTIHQ